MTTFTKQDFLIMLDKLSDMWYYYRVEFGMRFQGWFKPPDYDYAYFVDRYTLVKKKRVDKQIKTTMIVYPITGVPL